MLEAPVETVSTELDVNVFECKWCDVVYFPEDQVPTSGPKPFNVAILLACFAPQRVITNSATKGRWSDPKDGSTRIEQMRKCRVQKT